MTKVLAVVTRHDKSQVIYNFSDGATSQIVLSHIAGCNPLHAIKCVEVCTVTATFDNVTPIEVWLKTTERLTK